MGINFLRIGYILISTLFLTSCDSKSFDSKEALWAYIRNGENGYHFTKAINGVEYSLTYKPTDLLVHQELDNVYSNEDVSRLREKYGQYLYFNLSMSANGQELLNQKVGNRNEFGAMVNQLAFGMGDKVNLISQSNDTLQLMDYAYPRMYGMDGRTNILLVYEKNTDALKKDYLRLTLEDMGFGTGEIAIKLPTEKLRNQPYLEL
jgi:hypothetical protein